MESEDNVVAGLDDHTEEQKRTRKMTEKARLQKIEQLALKRDVSFTRVRGKMKSIRSHMNEYTYEQMVADHREWLCHVEDFLTAHDDYSKVLTDPECEKYLKDWYITRDDEIKDFKNRLEAWFKEHKKEDEEIQPTDSISQTGPKKSRHGSRSSSSSSSLSSTRAKHESEKAALLERQKRLKAAQALEIEKINLKHKEEQLRIETEIAVAQAKSKIVNDFMEQHSDSKQPKGQPIISQPQNESTTPTNEDIIGQPVTEHEMEPINNINVSTLNNVPTWNATESEPLTSTVIKKLQRPVIEIKRFSGDPIEFKKFLRQFETKIVAYTTTDDERMGYLEQYTIGQPNRIVSGFSYLDAHVGYSAAMKALRERYGQPDIMSSAFLKKALGWPPMKNDDPTSLDEYGIFLAECENAISNIETLKSLEHPDNMKRMVQKLPYGLHDKWRNIYYNTVQKEETVKFGLLVDFVKKEARKIVDPTYGKLAMMELDKKPQVHNLKLSGRPKGNFASNSKDNGQRYSTSSQEKKDYEKSKFCYYCKEAHVIGDCTKLSQLKYEDKIEYLKSKGICYGCLEKGHMRIRCGKRLTCSKCGATHPTVLHDENRRKDIDNKRSVEKKEECTMTEQTIPLKANANMLVKSPMGAGDYQYEHCTLAITAVKVKRGNSFYPITTYAFFDTGSNICFISTSLMQQLGIQGRQLRIKLETMGETVCLDSAIVKKLEIFNYDLSDGIIIPVCYAKETMPVDSRDIPKAEDVKQWCHLNNLPIPDPDCSIGLVIGNNMPEAYTPLETVTGPRGSPYASRTALGWILWNVIRINPEPSEEFKVNHAEVIGEYERLNELDRMVRQSTSFDFPEKTIDDKDEHSVMDKLFFEKVEKSVRMVNGRYEIGLPFKNDEMVLPNNRKQILDILKSWKSRLIRNDELYLDYNEFMKNLISKRYAEEVPRNEQKVDNSRQTWYLAHHGTYHKQKHKLRVVFNCSLKFNGISLNDTLLSGPDLANNLIGVLIRFRIGKIAIMSDIEAMYHQVKVPSKDRNNLRFFWWKDGQLDTEPIEYRMTSHLFGAVSSPSVANFALKRIASDFKDLFEEEVRETILFNFYVDDCLRSLDDKEAAKEMVQKLTEICALAGFRLHKWISNDTEVLNTVPESSRATCKQASLGEENSTVERALGVYWDVTSDCLTFKINIRDQPTTRRGLLSIIASVYDPLGLIAPAMLPPKLLLQGLCQKGLSWDENINEEQNRLWTKWLKELPILETVKLPRCLKTRDFGKQISAQLHNFSDASQHGYGIASYLRLEDDEGRIVCTLVLGKSRVSPSKKVTIPRLELTAATTSVKLSKKISDELRINIDKIFFWTDSTAVLSYIANTASRYQTFVANRVSFIRESTELDQWKYVNTHDNPADDASRGLTVANLVKQSRWFNGPEYLNKPESEWPNNEVNTEISESDVELKKIRISCAAAVMGLEDPIEKLLNYYSTFNRLKKAVAYLLWIKRELRQRIKCRKSKTKESKKNHCILTANDYVEAEECLIKHEQNKYLGDLSSKKMKEKSIQKLDPYELDGITRVGGRLDRSSLSLDSKHQIILPKQSRLSELIVVHTHNLVGHLGKNCTLSELRRRYWIIGASAIIKRILSKCVICRKYSARTNEQKMANLPATRITPGGLPFEYTGMDFFGPFEVKQRRSQVKRYGVIFTCFNSRAVHIEIAHTMDTNSCINAIRRFISRRGNPKIIRSDNGTNLVGAERELREAIENWNHQQINDELCQQRIKWEFNTPASSHHGGVWERIIRTVRKVLYSLQKIQMVRLDDESLNTLMCEVESVINRRPITRSSDLPDDVDTLTPNHLLLGGEQNEFTPVKTEPNNLYVRHRWKQVQYLTDLFWKRWTAEYLPVLQERKKWLQPKRNVTIGDIVMVYDNNLRNSWTLARVIDVKQDKTGLVRTVTVKTKTSTLDRPVTKLCTLLECDT